MSTEDEQLYKFLLELVDIKDSLEINDSLTTTNFVSNIKEFLSDTNEIYNENIIIKYLSISLYGNASLVVLLFTFRVNR